MYIKKMILLKNGKNYSLCFNLAYYNRIFAALIYKKYANKKKQ
jgi:hypothetical protein